MDNIIGESNNVIDSGDVLEIGSLLGEVTSNDKELSTQVIDNTNNNVPETNNGGNTHIMIIVIVICAVIGIALGIWRGKKAVTK